MSGARETEVAIVGGGPAGAALAIRLAAAGRDVVVFERRQRPVWRACGVYSSCLSRRRLLDLGLTVEALDPLMRPISAMVLRSLGGESVRLEYPYPYHAAGYDRPALDGALLAQARAAGARVHAGAVVRAVELGQSRAGLRARSRLLVSQAGEVAWWQAGLVVGADGPQSLVARAAGVAGRSRFLRRSGITLHIADPAAAPAGRPMDAHFFLADGWYCGVAPVPGGRVNVGLVMSERRLRAELRQPGGPAGVVARALAELPGPPAAWQAGAPLDDASVRLPLANHVGRTAGPGFALVGDAAGFVDPLSGEGLHRALASAALAADAVGRWAMGDHQGLTDYDRHFRARFRSKDIVSWVLQAFVAQPAVLGYALRRLRARPSAAHTFALVLADRVPASSVLDPRYLARLLAP